jgi:hypothetical protein
MDQPPRASTQSPNAPPYQPADAAPAGVTRQRGRRISIPGIVLGLALVGSVGFIAYVVLRIEDNQIPLMAAGFVALGATLALIAVWCLNGIWRAASRARGGRAFLLAILGGLAGLGAIGSFAVAAISMMVSTS